jgi:hypothetical protein
MNCPKPRPVKTIIILLAAILSHPSFAHTGSGRYNTCEITNNADFPDGIINVPPFLSFEEVAAFVDSVDSKGFVTAGYAYLNFQRWPVRTKIGSYPRSSIVALADELFLIQRIHQKKLSIILNIDAGTASSISALADAVTRWFALGIEIIVLNKSGPLPSENWRSGINALVKAKMPKDEDLLEHQRLWYRNTKGIYNTMADFVNHKDEMFRHKRQDEWAIAIKFFNQYFLNESAVKQFPYEKKIQLTYSNNISKGNGQLGVEEAKSQISLWCLAGFPLQISNDVRNINDIGKHILANGEIISLRTNAASGFSKCLYNESNMQVYVKQSSHRKEDGLIILIVNLDTIANKFILPAELFNFDSKFVLKDLWEQKSLGRFDAYVTVLPPHGCKVLRAVPE